MEAGQQIIEPLLDAFRSAGALAPELAAAADASAQTHSLRCSAERADRPQHARSSAEPRNLRAIAAHSGSSRSSTESAIWPPWKWIRATDRIVSRPELGSE
jgi:hypothetical protein